jgi:hypothetical protein
MDDLPILAIEKAFYILSQDDVCTIQHVHSIFQQFLCVVPFTHRSEPQTKELVHPYPLSQLEKLWQHLDEKISWEQFSKAISAECPEWLACPLYQLEVIDIYVGLIAR